LDGARGPGKKKRKQMGPGQAPFKKKFSAKKWPERNWYRAMGAAAILQGRKGPRAEKMRVKKNGADFRGAQEICR